MPASVYCRTSGSNVESERIIITFNLFSASAVSNALNPT